MWNWFEAMLLKKVKGIISHNRYSDSPGRLENFVTSSSWSVTSKIPDYRFWNVFKHFSEKKSRGRCLFSFLKYPDPLAGAENFSYSLCIISVPKNPYNQHQIKLQQIQSRNLQTLFFSLIFQTFIVSTITFVNLTNCVVYKNNEPQIHYVNKLLVRLTGFFSV